MNDPPFCHRDYLLHRASFVSFLFRRLSCSLLPDNKVEVSSRLWIGNSWSIFPRIWGNWRGEAWNWIRFLVVRSHFEKQEMRVDLCAGLEWNCRVSMSNGNGKEEIGEWISGNGVVCIRPWSSYEDIWVHNSWRGFKIHIHDCFSAQFTHE